MKRPIMSRSIKEIVLSVFALLLLMTLLQTPNLFFHFRSNFLFKIFFLVSIVVTSVWLYFSVRDYIHHRGIYYYCVQNFKSLSIPAAAKFAIVFVFSVNLIAISVGMERYPFYDVGMFRWSTDFTNKDKIVYEPKYYYWKNGHYKILDLRKEGALFLAEHFGWGYTEGFTFGATFHHKGEKENFQFLSRAMKERGVDTLWVGVHSVNFETREVTFDPDVCNAIRINQKSDLYYGPIYIPEYQMLRCDEH
jgi:hypothetical protein